MVQAQHVQMLTQSGTESRKTPLHGAGLRDTGRKGIRCVDHHGHACRAPYREVGGGVARVGEAPLAEALDKESGLGASAQVGRAIAGQHLVKNAQMRRNCAGDALVRSGAQDKAASSRALFAQPGDKGLIERQERRVELVAPRQLLLEHGLAARQPKGDAQHGQRLGAQQSHG